MERMQGVSVDSWMDQELDEHLDPFVDTELVDRAENNPKNRVHYMLKIVLM